MKNKKYLQFFAALFFGILSSCSGGQVGTSPLPTQGEKPLYTLIPATSTTEPMVPAATAALFPTERIVPPTLPNSATPTSTITTLSPTLTPLPKLSPEQAKELVIELMMDNANCDLPCFWGFHPGETLWQNAQHFLSSFADRIDEGPTEIVIKDGAEQSVTFYSISNTVPGYSEEISSLYRVTNGVIDQITVYPRGTEYRYQLHQVLMELGSPDDVMLFLSDVSPAGLPWFHFYLFYAKKGITFIYDGAAQFEGDVFEVCPAGLGPKLILIPPGSQPLSKMIREVDNTPTLFNSINDFPGKSVSLFYETMKAPDACLRFDPNETE